MAFAPAGSRPPSPKRLHGWAKVCVGSRGSCLCVCVYLGHRSLGRREEPSLFGVSPLSFDSCLKGGAVPCGCRKANNYLTEISRHVMGSKTAANKFSLLYPPSLMSLTPALPREDVNVGRMHVTQGRGEQTGARGQVHLPVQKREEKGRERTEMRPPPLQVSSIHPSIRPSVHPSQ